MSTARGGESSAFEPGLEHLIGALTASGHPDELAGRDAARAAFCAASQQPTAARSGWAWPASTWSAWRRRPIRLALPARLAVAFAVVAAVVGGFTAAATAQVLPAPVQRIAYTVLAPLGVPVSQPPQSRQSGSPGHPLSATGPAASHGGCQCPAAPSPNASAGPRHHFAEKPKAKAPTAKPVLRLVSGQIKDRLIVAAPSGKPGDIVILTKWTGTTWTTVSSAPLGPKLRAVFVLLVKTAAGHLFKAEILEGASHTSLASNRLWVPRPAKTGAKAIQPSPTASPTATGSPTPTPTPTLTSTTAPATSLGPTPSPTGSPAPTPTPDPTASATSPATSAPPQTPEPSTSSSTQARLRPGDFKSFSARSRIS